MFPSPLEVDRFISVENEDVETQEEESFRPLSRYIGLYQNVTSSKCWFEWVVSVPSRGI